MRLYSLSFVYLFLPAALLLFFLTPRRLRAPLLLLLSGVFYWMLEGKYILVPMMVAAFDYGMALLMGRCGEFPRLRRAILVCAAAKGAGILALYGVLHRLYGEPVPLGLGVVCLTSMGYVIDCYRGLLPGERNPIHYALFVGFFPKLYAGPLVHAGRMLPQVRAPRASLSQVGAGAGVFLRGLAKKVVLGDVMFSLFIQLKGAPLYDTTVLTVWSMVLAMAFSMYFILSGLCDMARGLGLMFGMELPENFSAPYCSLSVNEFFARFNITVNRFFRRHLYNGLGGAQGTVLSSAFNILFVTMLMGLWFGIGPNSLLWGAYFSAFILFERYFLHRYEQFIPPLFRWLYCSAVVLVSFVFFCGDSPAQSLEYLKIMFGMGRSAPSHDDRILYLLTSNYLALLASCVCVSALPRKAGQLLNAHLPKAHALLAACADLALLAVSTAFLL